jgi:uncharacterized protein YoxC
MKKTWLAKTAFLLAVALSLLLITLLWSNVKSIPEYTSLTTTGNQILECVLEMQAQERSYLLHRNEDALEQVKDKIDSLRKTVARLDKTADSKKEFESFHLGVLEEAMNLCERLFDQFVLHDKAVEKNVMQLRELEDSILAVIFSKMNPERGIIALQEIRIHEKRYLLYRGRSGSPEGLSHRDMRKKAVSDLLMWAQKDKRIEELMEKDIQMFKAIINNYQSLDDALSAIEKERGKIKTIADAFLEEGRKGLYTINRRSVFLSAVLLVMWLTTGTVVLSIRFPG